MDDDLTPLKNALHLFGLLFIFAGILLCVWPSGWRWEPYHPFYEQMILGVYATLGVFLVRAAKNPLDHLSLIWFTVWSSIVHGGIMLIQALSADAHCGHLYGDVPALFIVAAVLGFLTSRASAAASS